MAEEDSLAVWLRVLWHSIILIIIILLVLAESTMAESPTTAATADEE